MSLRYFNVAGAAGAASASGTPPRRTSIPIALQVATGRRASLHGLRRRLPDPDGTCVRDYIHVADLADAHLLALPAPAAGEHRVYNLGNGTGFSVQQVVDAVREVTGHPVPVEVAPRRAGDPAQLVASERPDPGRPGLEAPRTRTSTAMVRDAWAFTQTTSGDDR